MESEGKAAGGRVTCSCGGGGTNLQGTIILVRPAFQKCYGRVISRLLTVL